MMEQIFSTVLKRPKKAVFFSTAAVLVCAALFLLANPGKRESGAARFYGVIADTTSEDISSRVVIVPPYGELNIPEAEEIYPYIETDFSGLETGDLVRISFHEGEEVSIQETWPGSFSATAESIAVMGRGFELYSRDGGRYLVTVPYGMAPEAQENDLLEIRQTDLQTGEDSLLAEVPVLSVDASNYHIYVEMSADETQAFLSGFGFGIHCLITGRTADDQQAPPVLPSTEIGLLARDLSLPTDAEIDTLTPEVLSQDSIPDSIFRVYVRSLSRSLPGLDSYVVDGPEGAGALPPLLFPRTVPSRLIGKWTGSAMKPYPWKSLPIWRRKP